MKTRAELITKALVNLGIIAEGQSVSDNDVSKMDKMVDPSISLLAALDIYYVQDAGVIGPDGGEIEDEAFLPLADYVANKASGEFNLQADTKLQALGILAEANLRTLAAPKRTLRTLNVDPILRPRRFGSGTLLYG